jgi:hypothetical protein
MTRRWSLITGLAIALLAVGITAWLSLPAVALAQCGEPPKSSCITCHEKEDPVATKGEWHQIHAAKDICTSCHGGNATAADQVGAHQTVVAQPLSDIYTDCHACHPDDYASRAGRFAVVLGVTPGSCPTPTAAPTSASTAAPLLVTTPSSTPAAPASPSWPLMLSTLGVAGLFVLGLLALARHQLAHS